MNAFNQKRFFKISSSYAALAFLLGASSLIGVPAGINPEKASSSDINRSSILMDHSSTSDPTNNKISIDLVTVGDPGNFTSSKRHGAVPYIFSIGKFDVTADQYCAFLNAVAATDTYGLYDERMETDLTIPARIKRSGVSGSYTYSVISGKKRAPIVYISYLSAQRFCNWLENGQPLGPQKEGSTETGSYTLNGTTSTLFAANKGAKWRLPNRDELFKAAYYKGGGIAAGYWHDFQLVGAYGTYGAAGYIFQWSSGTKSFPTQKIHLKDNDDNRNCRNADYKTNKIGFRVVGPTPETDLQ